MIDFILIISIAGAVIGLLLLYGGCNLYRRLLYSIPRADFRYSDSHRIPVKYIPDAVVEELPPEDEVPDAKETRRDRVKKMKEKQALADSLKAVKAEDDEYEEIEMAIDIEAGNNTTKNDSNCCCCLAFNHAPIEVEHKVIKRVKKVKKVVLDDPVSIDRNAVKNAKKKERNSILNPDSSKNETKEEVIEYITLSESVTMKHLLTLYYTRFDEEKLKNIDKLLEKYTDKELELIDALEKKYGKLIKHKEKVQNNSALAVPVPESVSVDDLMINHMEDDGVTASPTAENVPQRKKKKRILYQQRRGAVSDKGQVAESSSSSSDDGNADKSSDDSFDIHPIKELPIGSSLYDLDRTERRKETLAWRKSIRETKKMKRLREGEIDTIALNSGPLPRLIPPGYVQSQNVPIELVPANLLKRKIFYLWEGDTVKAQGWFIGTICAPSKSEGFNFNIKYDKFVTMNHYVDGIHKVNLSLSGDNAYGRRWVLLDRVDSSIVDEM